jgi:hypothetical protein
MNSLRRQFLCRIFSGKGRMGGGPGQVFLLKGVIASFHGVNLFASVEK